MNWNTDDPAISQTLGARWEWLEHQAVGSAATRRATWRDLGDAGAAEDRVRQSHTGRYPIELLQNAHDACADIGVTATAWFAATDTALLVANEGIPFTADRIESLTRFGSSEKGHRKVRHHLIGYKGIGFTAVFEITDRPQVISRNVAFTFDRQEALKRVSHKLGPPQRSERLPARYFPLPLAPESWSADADRVKRLFEAGAVTVIRLPFRRGWGVEKVLRDLRSSISAEMLLFTSAISRLEIISDVETYGWNREPGRSVGKAKLWHLVSTQGIRLTWLVRAGVVPVPASEAEALRDELWKNVRKLNVAVAVPWSAGPVAEPNAQPIFAYFPTADRLGRGMLIHGDFYLDEARQRIAGDGPQGVISNRVAEGAAKLLAEIAEAAANQGNKLLACLAPVEQPDGYGNHVAAKLDEALRTARIIRPADGSRPKRPTELGRIGSALSVEKERKFVELLSVRSDLVRPGDDIGRAADLLKNLGCDVADAVEVASRLEPGRARMEYGAALNLVENWVEQLDYNYLLIGALGKRPIVQNHLGRWCKPTDVYRRDAATPPLPSVLERPELMVPGSSTARKFIERLSITTITAKTALDLIRDCVSNDSELSSTEKAQVLFFVWRLWNSDPGVVRSRGDLGVIPVPAKAAGGRGKVTWTRADLAYFGSAWTGNRVLEALYGPFGRTEFFTELRSLKAGKREQEVFLRAIGVADRPRMLPISGYLSQYWEWNQLPEVSSAYACPDSHPSTKRDVDGLVMDRLDDLLARIEKQPRFSHTFVRGLLLLDDPYGLDVRVVCTHGAHRGTRRGNRAKGYQRWRLQEVAWVPVDQHPGVESLAKPSEAWVGMPRTSADLLVPRITAGLRDVKRLELVDADSPGRAEVERALHLLHDAYPEPSAEQHIVWETADWLLRRLERAVQRKSEPGDAPPFCVLTPSGPGWFTRPAIPDSPGMPALPGVPVLPIGRWSALRRAYRLPLASELIHDEVELGRRLSIAPLLTETHKAELVALLIRLGSPQTVASRLAVLREQSAASIMVTWHAKDGGQSVTEQRPFHLKMTRDRAGRVLRATLFRSGDLDPDTVALGRAIAGFLDALDHEHTIALYLTTREHLVKQQGVSNQDVSEALELLRRRRVPKPEEVIEPPEEDVSETPSEVEQEEVTRVQVQSAPDAEESSGPTSTVASSSSEDDQPGGKPGSVATPGLPTRYLDARVVRFGQPRAPERPAARAQRDSRSEQRASPAQSSASFARSDDAVLSANPIVEDAAMKIAERYGYTVENAARVLDVHTANKGWDLEFHLSTGSFVPVEVKGSSGNLPFVITRNEWRAAREHSHYLLIHVVNLSDPENAVLRVFRRLGERLSEQHMAVTSWVVRDWFQLEPEELPIVQSKDS